MATEEEQSLRDCDNYIQTHRIQRVFKDCIVQLCVCRPENPIPFLRQYFQKLERVSSIISKNCVSFSLTVLFCATKTREKISFIFIRLSYCQWCQPICL